MPADALAITLAAAIVHAAWNAGLASAGDAQGATAAAMASGAVLLAPFGLLTWDIGAKAWPYLAGSIVAETAYMALLARAYARAELSVVYPVARGSAPVLVLIVAGATALQAVGVVVVALGVLAVRGIKRPESWADIGLALAIGATIATYTLIDKQGLEHAGTLPYLWIEVGTAGVLFAAFVGPQRVRSAFDGRMLAVGAAAFGSYGLVLAALKLAPAAAVAAVRETSVVFAVAIAAVWLGERVSWVRAAGAVVVTAGVALVALG